MENYISKIIAAAEKDLKIAKIAGLAKEPTELYEIVSGIERMVKKSEYDKIAELSTFDIFKLYFCFNNDTMALVQVGQIDYFDIAVNYFELYDILEEAQDCINSWTFDNAYPKIRLLLDAQNINDVINACQQLGLPPEMINYDIRQSFISMSNFLYFKKQYAEIKKSNMKPAEQKREIRELYSKVMSGTLTQIIDRNKATRRFYTERKNNCKIKEEHLKDLMAKFESGELENLDMISGDWHVYFDVGVKEPLYEMLLENHLKRHDKVVKKNQSLKAQINETPFIAYLYQNQIDPKSLQEDLLIKANSIPFEELEQKINFFLKLSISLQELLLLNIHYLFNTDLNTINKFNFYLDKGIIKKETIKKDLSILDKLNIINTNYSILKNIIDITSPYYSDSVLLLQTTELKRRLSILGQYGLSINNYMFLLINFNYINIYDLLIENKIPTYLFIPICKTEDPKLTVKKIMISKELNVPYENNGRLTKEIRAINGFMCPNEDIDDYIEDTVSEYIMGNIQRSTIDSVLKHPLVIQLDTSHRYGETYMFGKTRISRPKVLSKLQTLLNKKQDIDNYLLFCILSESILNDRNIAEIKKATSKKTI